MGKIGRLVLVLGLIGIGSAVSLAWVRTSLAPRIEQQEDFYVRGPALARLFHCPAEEVLANKVVIDTETSSYPVFFRTDGGEIVGLAVQAAGRGGYGGDIVMMIGIDQAAGELLGVEIISHSETPGLGANVAKDEFRQQWAGLSTADHVALRSAGGSIDALSGATFSSGAMMDGTNQILDLLQAHTEDIMTAIDQKTTSGGAS